MPSLKEVKSRISSVKNTQQITKAMKMVAAAKLRKAQDRILQLRPFAEKLNGILGSLSNSVEIESPYLESREGERTLLIVISSDRGLCGAFNSNVLKTATRHIEENYKYVNGRRNLFILPIGRKAYDYFKKNGFQVNHKHYELFQDLTFEKVRHVAEEVMYGFEIGDYDKVELIYNEFKNVATQVLKVDNYLPVTAEQDDNASDSGPDYIYEPSKEEIVTELIPKSLKLQLYKALLESNASEQGARMTAMDKASDNASELKLTYNRTRQAAITKEILEIVGGAEALKG